MHALLWSKYRWWRQRSRPNMDLYTGSKRGSFCVLTVCGWGDSWAEAPSVVRVIGLDPASSVSLCEKCLACLLTLRVFRPNDDFFLAGMMWGHCAGLTTTSIWLNWCVNVYWGYKVDFSSKQKSSCQLCLSNFFNEVPFRGKNHWSRKMFSLVFPYVLSLSGKL